MLDHGESYLVQSVVRANLASISISVDREELRQVLHAMDCGLESGFQRYGDRARQFEAVSHLLKGEILERLEDDESALRANEKAIERDAKVGVKRRIDSLKTKLSGDENRRA